VNAIYSYRSSFNKKVYKTNTMKRLIHNYGNSYLKISRYYQKEKNFGEAIKYMEEMLKFVENKETFYPFLSKLYVQAAFYLFQYDFIEEGFIHLENAIFYQDEDEELLSIIYQVAIYTGEREKSISLLNKMKVNIDENQINIVINDIRNYTK
jgi:tetratricopeptide (TPR) repeat protein